MTKPWPFTSTVRLRSAEREPARVAAALDRVGDLLEREGRMVSIEGEEEGEAGDTLRATLDSGAVAWSASFLGRATRGEVVIWREHRGGEATSRVRVRFRPGFWALVEDALVLECVLLMVLRHYRLVPLRGFATNAWTYALALAALAALTPLLRLRFTGMFAKALRASEAEWARYSGTWRVWRRVVIAAVLLWLAKPRIAHQLLLLRLMWTPPLAVLSRIPPATAWHIVRPMFASVAWIVALPCLAILVDWERWVWSAARLVFPDFAWPLSSNSQGRD